MTDGLAGRSAVWDGLLWLVQRVVKIDHKPTLYFNTFEEEVL